MLFLKEVKKSHTNITLLDRVLAPLYKYIDFLERFNDFIAIRHAVKNWPTVMLFRISLKHTFTMHLRDGKKVEIKRQADYFNFWNSEKGQYILLHTKGFTRGIIINMHQHIASIEFQNKNVLFNYSSIKQLGNACSMIKEQFIRKDYKWLKVYNLDVVDIGANIGDSAIYFGLNGAKHVYAFEPYPSTYKLAIKNVKSNKLENKITILNQGCGKSTMSILIPELYESSSDAKIRKFTRGKAIKIVTLKKIVEEYNVTDAILKIDCEGCEYGILINAPNTVLRRFKQVQIEYHYGYLDIKRKLESAGFIVKNTLPRYHFDTGTENQPMLIGMLYAERNE